MIACETESGLRQILPTLVGGLLAILGGFVAKAWQDDRQKRALRCAIASEIRAIMNLLRPAREGTLRAVARMKADPKAAKYPIVDFRNTYSTVFSGNAPNIGLLRSDLAGEIVAFYYQFQGLIEELAILEKRVAADDPVAIVISRNERIIQSCDAVIATGADLVNCLDPPPK